MMKKQSKVSFMSNLFARFEFPLNYGNALIHTTKHFITFKMYIDNTKDERHTKKKTIVAL